MYKKFWSVCGSDIKLSNDRANKEQGWKVLINIVAAWKIEPKNRLGPRLFIEIAAGFEGTPYHLLY
jgi:hypothetical protein